MKTDRIAFRFGFGHHGWNVMLDKMMGYQQMLVGICVIYAWTPALTKFSLLFLYYRIGTQAWMRIAIYALALLTFGYTLSITIVVVGPCNPQINTAGKCLKDLNLFMAISKSSFCTLNQIVLIGCSQYSHGFLHHPITASNVTLSSATPEAKGSSGPSVHARIGVNLQT